MVGTQIQLMKTRSSSGVGAKIDLEFDIDSLRIRDLAEDEDSIQEFNKRKSTIYEGLKRTSVTPMVKQKQMFQRNPTEGDTVGKHSHRQT